MSKILLAEDNHINQIVATQMLEQLGHKVRHANNGIEAVELVSVEVFDLVIMDCQMPEMDGYEASAKIKSMVVSGEIADLPIIAFTAQAMEGDKEKCFAAGMDDYVSKPVDENRLKEAVDKWALKNSSAEVEQPMAASTLKYIDESVIGNLAELMGDGFKDLVIAYKTNIEKLIEDMGDAINKSDFHTLSQLAHTVKSPSAQMGVTELSKLAAELEVSAKTNSIDENAEAVLKIQDIFLASNKEMSSYAV